MGFEKHSKTVSIALFALVILSLGTNALLYLQVQHLQEQRSFLETSLAELQADINNLNSQLLEIQTSTSKTVYARILRWEPQNIPAHSRIEGYVYNWTVEEAMKIVHVEVWMGNPYDILWEGNTIVTLNNTNPWDPPPDMFLAHYQFDSHDESSLPHQKSFDLRPGHHIDAGMTISIYRVFVNFDDKDTTAGDGFVILYYIIE